MEGGFSIYSKLQKRNKYLNKRIKELTTEIKRLPKGKLVCCGSSWYQSNGHTKTYVKKDNKQLAEKLAVKKYLSSLLEDLQKEKIATDMYLRHYPKKKKLDEIFKSSETFQKLLLPYFLPLSKELDEWMKSPFQTNLRHPEHLNHKVGSNEFVRSKSEAMIVKVLKHNKIPYRYECQLLLGEVEVYPDFTIRHPRTGEVFYWEHFGMLDKPEYVKNMHSKMQLFTANDIIPGINLITTYETKENPLTFEMIEFLVEHYFL